MTMRTTLLIIGLVLATLAGPALAAPPKMSEDKDKFVLQNDHVSVWFQGKKPMLKVMPASAPEGAEAVNGFAYTFTSVVEYRDLDANGVVGANEVVASLDLHKASAWNVTSASAPDGAVTLDLRLVAPVKLGKGDLVPEGAPVALPNGTPLPTRDASIGLVFTIRDAATTIDAGGVNATVPATSVKYDFVVDSWPFVDAAQDRLALVSKVTGALEAQNATGVEGASVAANGTDVGALSWTTIATGNTTKGETIDVPVKATMEADAAGETTLTYTYDAADLATLVHDPTIGVVPTEAALESAADTATGALKDVPAPGVALAAVGVAAAALVVGRRR
ncbi:MAG TPA: hypothetical protein VM370_07505 [Candidatus Thermoplasmatota archaeon]|nr:hypothetical protein [Candidatus Thermoplasmatota archaeon]